MQRDPAADSGKSIPGAVDDFWEEDDQEPRSESVLVRPPASYRQAFGNEPIRVGIVEFRIMLFLARRPYHAFTPRQIADAVTADGRPVAEGAVDGHIATLRDQLGVLHDFVQSVPYIGYRYKP
jgi:DNA-binding response OmpR family regulator